MADEWALMSLDLITIGCEVLGNVEATALVGIVRDGSNVLGRGGVVAQFSDHVAKVQGMGRARSDRAGICDDRSANNDVRSDEFVLTVRVNVFSKRRAGGGKLGRHGIDRMIQH